MCRIIVVKNCDECPYEYEEQEKLGTVCGIPQYGTIIRCGHPNGHICPDWLHVPEDCPLQKLEKDL